MKRIIIVANSENVIDINDNVKDTDIIVRFNSPKVDSLLKTGKRTNFLFIANTFNMYEHSFLNNLVLNNCILNSDVKKIKIVLPYSHEIINQVNPYRKTKEIKRKFFIKYKVRKRISNANNDKLIEYLSERGFSNTEVLTTNNYLKIKKKSNIPNVVSTGLIAIDYFLNSLNFKDYSVHLNGFTHDGGYRHDWSIEKKYINKLIDNGSLNRFR